MRNHLPSATLILSPGLCLLLVAAWQVGVAGADRDPDWVATMKQVHSKYRGERGVLVQFGDSITNGLDNGTIVILSTIPPRHGFTEEAAEFSEIIRSIARDLEVPLIDYHAEILKRRPDDWDGALDKFEDYQGYDVPTLIARDGVHPSAPKQYRGDYSAESLTRNGFELRNYLTLLKYGEVIDRVLTAQK